MWRISIVFLHILIFYLIISNQRHSIIYWWISKSNSSKESCCEVEYEAYDKIHMWRISIVFFAYFDFVFYEPLKHDTYSPYISLIICIITYYPLAIFWAITFENPSIIEETAAIWNYTSFLLLLLPTVLISNHCHSIIYWWISKSNSSKESCCEVEYEAYDKIHMCRISIAFFAYLNFHFGPIWLVLKI